MNLDTRHNLQVHGTLNQSATYNIKRSVAALFDGCGVELEHSGDEGLLNTSMLPLGLLRQAGRAL